MLPAPSGRTGVFVLSLILAALPASAASVHWIGGAGLWSDPANWSSGSVPTSADDVVIDTNATVRAPANLAPIAFATLKLGGASGINPVWLELSTGTASGGYLEVFRNSRLISSTTQRIVFSSVTVYAGGLLTHAQNTAALSYALNIQAPGGFDLKAGSSIAVDGLGYSEKNGPGPGAWRHNGLCGGGSHGGLGISFQEASVYDSITDPSDAGSGGGGSDFHTGGSGGGVVIIDAGGGTVAINGVIQANGTIGGGFQAGGGAGGTVNIKSSVLTGSGTIGADGADAFNLEGAGGGGGGRVALSATASDASSLTVTVGSGRVGDCSPLHLPPYCGNGATGTIYRNRAGKIELAFINNNAATSRTPVTAALLGSNVLSVATITVRNSYASFLDVDLTVVSSAAFGGQSELEASRLTAVAPVVLSSGVSLIHASTRAWSFSTLTMMNGSSVTHWLNGSAVAAGVNLDVSGALVVGSGAAIAANGNGFSGGASGAVGTGAGGGTGSSRGAGGGGYGGQGGAGSGGAAGGPVNGAAEFPPALGSGGGGGGGSAGGAGGGSINLAVAGTLTINGVIAADGAPGAGGTNGGGGGSGGRIHATFGSVAGTGVVRANGGAGGSGSSDPGGGGGGGRITGFGAFGGAVVAGGGASGGAPATGGSAAVANPTTVGAPAASVLGISSVSWTWSAADATSYRVYDGASTSTFLAAVATTSYVRSGLTPNTSYAITVTGSNSTSTSAATSASAVFTLAAPPASFSATSVYATSATLAWSSNGNPAATSAELSRSTDAVAYSVILTSTVTSAAATGLAACTTYYARVRNIGFGGANSDYAATVFRTALSTPSAPSALEAASLAGSRIRLTWTASPSSDVAGYRIYFDSGTGTISYASPWAVVGASVTTYDTPVLISSDAYMFGLRAIGTCGNAETNTDLRATAPATNALPAARAAIKTPDAGKRIKGNRVTVSAEIVVGSISQVRQVRFQYKAAAASAWSDIVAATPNHANPDASSPFFVHWDVTALADGLYDLRAVARDTFDVDDSTPPSIRIQITSSATDFDVNETASGGVVQKQQVVDSGAAITIQSGDATAGQLAKVAIPVGALSSSTLTITVVNNPAGTPAGPSDASAIGASLQVDLSNGQSQLSGGRTAALTIFYPDSDGDGIVDGTTVRADRLQMYYYDGTSASWRRDFSSTVDLTARSVVGQTPHFSLFGLFAPSASALDSIRVYPNPYRPNGTDPNQGIPYSPGAANSGIVFDNMPSAADVRVYDLSGRQVARLSADASGRVQWDARDSSGKDLPSGGYLAVISGAGSGRTTRKLLIIR